MTETTTDERVFDPDRLAAVRRSGLQSLRSADHLDRLARFAATLTGAPVALVSIVDGGRQVFAGMAGTVGDGSRSTALEYSVCRTVVEQESPLVLNELLGNGEFRDHPARLGLGVAAYCGVPIRDPQGNVLGSFCVIDDESHNWTHDTVRTLEGLAELVTDTVQVNLDYSAMIMDLQHRLLPARMPQPAGGTIEGIYRPVPYSERVGGDFYDAVLGADGSIHVILGDVVGHGVGSTQAAAQLRAAGRAVVVGTSPSPADVINAMASSCAELPGCDAAAVIVVRIESDGRTVSWARAGAMPPITVGADARVRHEAAGPPLGFGRLEASDECTVTLASGDRFVVFTDGLVERRDEALDVGLERLLHVASTSRGVAPLLDACPLEAQTDDVAAVVYTVNGAA